MILKAISPLNFIIEFGLIPTRNIGKMRPRFQVLSRDRLASLQDNHGIGTKVHRSRPMYLVPGHWKGNGEYHQAEDMICFGMYIHD